MEGCAGRRAGVCGDASEALMFAKTSVDWMEKRWGVMGAMKSRQFVVGVKGVRSGLARRCDLSNGIEHGWCERW